MSKLIQIQVKDELYVELQAAAELEELSVASYCRTSLARLVRGIGTAVTGTPKEKKPAYVKKTPEEKDASKAERQKLEDERLREAAEQTRFNNMPVFEQVVYNYDNTTFTNPIYNKPPRLDSLGRIPAPPPGKDLKWCQRESYARGMLECFPLNRKANLNTLDVFRAAFDREEAERVRRAGLSKEDRDLGDAAKSAKVAELLSHPVKTEKRPELTLEQQRARSQEFLDELEALGNKPKEKQLSIQEADPEYYNPYFE